MFEIFNDVNRFCDIRIRWIILRIYELWGWTMVLDTSLTHSLFWVSYLTLEIILVWNRQYLEWLDNEHCDFEKYN